MSENITIDAAKSLILDETLGLMSLVAYIEHTNYSQKNTLAHFEIELVSTTTISLIGQISPCPVIV